MGRNDPWQVGKSWWGLDCRFRMSGSNGSKSIVLTEGRYASEHGVLMDPNVKAAVKEFFEANLK